MMTVGPRTVSRQRAALVTVTTLAVFVACGRVSSTPTSGRGSSAAGSSSGMDAGEKTNGGGGGSGAAGGIGVAGVAGNISMAGGTGGTATGASGSGGEPAGFGGGTDPLDAGHAGASDELDAGPDAEAGPCGYDLPFFLLPCQHCSQAACCDEEKTCADNPECVALLNCFMGCPPSQSADCGNHCVDMHDPGLKDFNTVHECFPVKCRPCDPM
jgi:hypothetical protein